MTTTTEKVLERLIRWIEAGNPCDHACLECVTAARSPRDSVIDRNQCWYHAAREHIARSQTPDPVAANRLTTEPEVEEAFRLNDPDSLIARLASDVWLLEGAEMAGRHNEEDMGAIIQDLKVERERLIGEIDDAHAGECASLDQTRDPRVTTCDCWVDGALTRAIEKCPEMSGQTPPSEKREPFPGSHMMTREQADTTLALLAKRRALRKSIDASRQYARSVARGDCLRGQMRETAGVAEMHADTALRLLDEYVPVVPHSEEEFYALTRSRDAWKEKAERLLEEMQEVSQ